MIRTFGIGKGKARWPRLALVALVDVCSSDGWRGVFACDAAKSDIVADGVLMDVDTVLEDTLGSRLTRSGSTGGRDDLVWGSLYIVVFLKVEEFLALLPLVVLPLLLPVLVAVLGVFVLLVVSVVAGCGGSDSESGAQKSKYCWGSEKHVDG